MSFVTNNLEPGEHVVFKAHVRWAAYVYPLLLLILLLSPGRLSALLTTELALTNKRLLGTFGVFYKKRLDVPYASVGVVRARQGWVGQLFDYGSVAIVGNDGSRINFRGIAEPVDIKIQIDEAVEMAVLGHKFPSY